jgi:cytochrome c556
MKFATKSLVLGLIMVGGIALAESKAADPDVHARQNLMQSNGGAVGALGGMAKGEAAFDAAAAEAAKQQLITNAAGIAAAFTNNASDPEARAKPDVWTNWDDFAAKAAALGAAAAALDASSLDGIKAGLGAIGGACKDCHMAYKAS